MALVALTAPARAVEYTITGLGGLGGSVQLNFNTFSVAAGYSINASGQVTGSSVIPGDSVSDAFFYSGGVMTDLGTLGDAGSQGNGINASGQITGVSQLPGICRAHLSIPAEQ